MIRLPQAILTAFLTIVASAAWAEPDAAGSESVAAANPAKPSQQPEPSQAAEAAPAEADHGKEPEVVALPVEPVSAPIQMMRTLQLMQDQIGLGSTEAFAAQRGLLTVLDSRFMELENETWKDEKNLRAAIVFVLSGGKPQLLRKILGLSIEIVPADRRPLVEGALAYVEGREEEAKRALLPLDATTLPASFGAQIALVQSALVVRTEPRKSLELLDWVRLVAPGTLLEEGALRREVFVASQVDDARKFELLVIRYLRQYRSSIYAGNFRQRLASALTRIDFGKDPERFARVVAMLDELEADVQRDLYLLMARASVDQGHVKSAVMTAGKALELSRNDKTSATRANLYAAAAQVVDAAALEKSVQTLKSLDRAVLPPSDITLLESALSLAQQIRLSPEKTAKDAPKVADQSTATQASDQLPVVLKAKDALSRVDKLIKN